jgi:hypothetical protein
MGRWKVVVSVYLNAPSQHSPGKVEENYKNLKPG